MQRCVFTILDKVGRHSTELITSPNAATVLRDLKFMPEDAMYKQHPDDFELLFLGWLDTDERGYPTLVTYVKDFGSYACVPFTALMSDVFNPNTMDEQIALLRGDIDG